MQSPPLPATALLLLLSLAAQISATCNRFIQSGNIYPSAVTAQSQRISNGTLCGPAYNNNSDSIGGYGGCSGGTLGNRSGCIPTFGGTATATGTTNLSLTAADAAYLFPLVNASLDFNRYTAILGGSGFYQSYSGCVPQVIQYMDPCIPAGASGYSEFVPFLNCVNGTLDECGAGDPIANGTAVSICGVGAQHWTADDGDSAYARTYPYGYAKFVNTTVAQAQALTSNPADNATCTAYYTSAGGRLLGRGGGGLMFIAAVVVTVAVVV